MEERSRLDEVEFGDYSYIMWDGSVWCATIGKFANIAACTRINAPNHPSWRATLHHFTYRASDYWEDADHETSFFAWRRGNAVSIGNDTFGDKLLSAMQKRLNESLVHSAALNRSTRRKHRTMSIGIRSAAEKFYLLKMTQQRQKA